MSGFECEQCGTAWESLSAAGECATIDRVEARQARHQRTPRVSVRTTQNTE